MDSGPLPPTTGTTPVPGLPNFGLSPQLLSALSSLPKAQTMSSLPTLSAQTTLHTSTSPATTLMDSHPSIDIGSSAMSGIAAAPVSAADEFKQNTSLVLSAFIPRVQEIARAILQDLARSYETENPAAQVASNIVQLKSSLMELHSILRQSGVGSLPITFAKDGSSTIGTLNVDEATANVSAAYTRATQCRENSSIVQNILEQDLPAKRAY
ncbi:hypothetical protein FRC12_014364 [Ceratobasidium sp. 428]|nr:hypothetical protein FRC12_014364 [Ceratobasidium sp. 428]